jgi:uncharacterized protein YndB with AHSA1/START domain
MKRKPGFNTNSNAGSDGPSGWWPMPNNCQQRKTPMTEANHFDLEISKLIRAPREIVWRIWTDPEHLRAWWCPKPWTTEVKAFDLRPGGSFHTFMQGPDGGTSDNPGCFLEIVPLERLVSTSTLLGGFRPAPDAWMPMTVVHTFSEAEGGTRWHARVMHATEAGMKQHEEMGFYQGWEIMAQQMDEYARSLCH